MQAQHNHKPTPHHAAPSQRLTNGRVVRTPQHRRLAPVNSAVSQTGKEPARPEELFDRKDAKKQLLKVLGTSSKPTNLKIMLGPKSSGKSLLVYRTLVDPQVDPEDGSVLETVAVLSASMGEDPQHSPSTTTEHFNQFGDAPVAYLDLRVADVRTPSGMASSLLRTLDSWQPGILAALRECKDVFTFKVPVSPNGASMDIKPFHLLGSNPTAPNLQDVIRLFNAMARHGFAAGQPRPIIIVDEANKLALLGQSDPTLLDILLDTFVRLGKQEGQVGAHILLISSNAAFVDYISQRTSAAYHVNIYIDDFDKDMAKQYLLRITANKKHLHDSIEKEFEGMFEVTGGNPGAIQVAVEMYETRADVNGWKEAAEVATGAISDELEKALAVGPNAVWTEQQLLYICSRVVKQDMPLLQLVKGLNNRTHSTNGYEVVLALMRANILGLRPSKGNKFNLVVPDSAAMRYYMNQQLASWEKLEQAAQADSALELASASEPQKTSAEHRDTQQG